MKLSPFELEPRYRDYVWGGERLRPGYFPTAEVWAIHEENIVQIGDLKGQSLSNLAVEFGSDLLGTKVTERFGRTFPILVKLLDCNQWLSLQVHPDDRQAVAMEGVGQSGKTEAWYFCDAADNSEILCGTKGGVNRADIERSVRDGTILECANRIPIQKGDYVLIPAGTIHALGPGLLVYEVQENSDITYRVFDWNRPASAGRKLHIEQSIRVIDPDSRAQIHHADFREPETRLVSCEYFTLDRILPDKSPVSVKLDGTSFHALTVIEGTAEVAWAEGMAALGKYQSLIIPACTNTYTIKNKTGCELLRVTA